MIMLKLFIMCLTDVMMWCVSCTQRCELWLYIVITILQQPLNTPNCHTDAYCTVSVDSFMDLCFGYFGISRAAAMELMMVTYRVSRDWMLRNHWDSTFRVNSLE